MKVSNYSHLNEIPFVAKESRVRASKKVEKVNATTYTKTQTYKAVDQNSHSITAHFDQREGSDRRKSQRWCLLDTRSGGDRRRGHSVAIEI